MFTELKRLVKIFRIKRQGKNVLFASGANLDQNARFEGQNKVGAHSWFEGYMGYGSYIGDECVIKAKVGRFCSIGHKVTILTGTHPSQGFVSTSPMFFSLGLQNGATFIKRQKFKEKVFVDEKNQYGAVIGNDVWIGYGATIMGGVTIGDGAIVAAGALVRNDVTPYTVVAGQPAKEIGRRFTNSQIDWLMDFKWWERPIEWIRENADDFENIGQFINEHSKEIGEI